MTYGDFEQLAVDERLPPVAVLERGLGDHPDLVVDLDRLGAGVAQLLEPVEQLVAAHAALRVGHGDPDARARRRHGAGEDAERGRPAAGLLQRRTAGPVSLRRESRVCSSWAISLSARCEASERLLMYWIRSPCRAADVVVVLLVGLHLGHGGEAEHAPAAPPTVTWPREPGRRSAASSRLRPSPAAARRPSGSGQRVWVIAGSRVEDVPADRGDVGEDPDAEHHDHAGGQLAADAELVAEVDDQRRRSARWRRTRPRRPCRRRSRRGTPAARRRRRRGRRRRRSAGRARARSARRAAGPARAPRRAAARCAAIIGAAPAVGACRRVGRDAGGQRSWSPRC